MGAHSTSNTYPICIDWQGSSTMSPRKEDVIAAIESHRSHIAAIDDAYLRVIDLVLDSHEQWCLSVQTEDLENVMLKRVLALCRFARKECTPSREQLPDITVTKRKWERDFRNMKMMIRASIEVRFPPPEWFSSLGDELHIPGVICMLRLY